MARFTPRKVTADSHASGSVSATGIAASAITLIRDKNDFVNTFNHQMDLRTVSFERECLSDRRHVFHFRRTRIKAR